MKSKEVGDGEGQNVHFKLFCHSKHSLSHVAQLYLRRPKVTIDFWRKVLMINDGI